MSRKRKVGILPKNRSVEWLPNWLPLEDVFQRMRERLGSSKAAKEELYTLLRIGECASAKRQISSYGEETFDVLSAEFWKDVAYLSVEIDADRSDHIAVHYPDYSLSDRPAEFFVRTADVELLYPTIAAPPLHTSVAVSREPTMPANKPKKTKGTRLISLMEETGLEKGLLLHEAREKVRPRFKKKYPHLKVPADSTIDRAYKKYANATDTSAE